MEIHIKKGIRVVLLLIALSGWFAILVQFYLMMENRTASMAETTIRFFSFFTILTNLMVAICCTVLLLGPKTKRYSFFARSTTLTATVTYITIVGLVYNVILRRLWSPVGMQKLVDELLHTLIPLLFILFWFVFVNCTNLKWKDFFIWLVYPLAYLVYTLVRGAFFEFYPYPFVDVTALGLKAVLVNSLALTLIFAVFSLLFIGIGKLKSRFVI